MSPVLALSSGGAVLFSISVQLRTGRLALSAAAGPDLAGFGVDLAALIQAVRAPPGIWNAHAGCQGIPT